MVKDFVIPKKRGSRPQSHIERATWRWGQLSPPDEDLMSILLLMSMLLLMLMWLCTVSCKSIIRLSRNIVKTPSSAECQAKQAHSHPNHTSAFFDLDVLNAANMIKEPGPVRIHQWGARRDVRAAGLDSHQATTAMAAGWSLRFTWHGLQVGSNILTTKVRGILWGPPQGNAEVVGPSPVGVGD